MRRGLLFAAIALLAIMAQALAAGYYDFWVFESNYPYECYYAGGYYIRTSYVFDTNTLAFYFESKPYYDGHYENVGSYTHPFVKITYNQTQLRAYHYYYRRTCAGYAARYFGYRYDGYSPVQIATQSFGSAQFAFQQKDGTLCFYGSNGVYEVDPNTGGLSPAPASSTCRGYANVGQYTRVADVGDPTHYAIVWGSGTTVGISFWDGTTLSTEVNGITLCGQAYEGNSTIIVIGRVGQNFAFTRWHYDTNTFDPIIETNIATVCSEGSLTRAHPGYVADFDKDGKLEAAFGGYGRLYIVEISGPNHVVEQNIAVPHGGTYVGVVGPTNASDIRVANFAPIASFTYTPTSPTDTDTVSFTASVTDYDGDPVTCNWDFGDGATATGCTASHVFASGTYVVTLSACDPYACTTVSKTIIVAHVNHPPTASFTHSPNPAIVNEVTTFYADVNDPDGDPLTCTWDFGDTATATGCGSVTHTYSAAGDYTVTLTVCDDYNACATDTHTILVDSKPSAFFSYFPTYPTTDDTVVFTGNVSDPDAGDTVTCTWDFGDGTTTGVSCSQVSHHYTDPNNYLVTLTACDNHGVCTQYSAFVKISRADHPPSADFTYSPQNPTTDDVVTFTPTVSDPEGEVVECMWDLGDGTTIPRGACSPITHQYAAQGTYDVNLTACQLPPQDVINHAIDVCNSSKSVGINLSNGLCLDSQYNGYALAVVVNGNGHCPTYPDYPEVTLDDNCNYTSVLDNNRTCTTVVKSLQVYYVNHPPTVDFNITPAAPTTSDVVVFTPIVSDPDGDPITCTWIIGLVQITGCNEVNYQFTHPGTYTVTLQASDGTDVGSKSVQITVTSGNHPPLITLTVSNANTDNISPVRFTLSVYDPDGDDYNCTWDFGDGTTSTECGTVTHQYYEAGTYTATVTVCDTAGACASDSATIYVTKKNILPTGSIYVDPATPFTGTTATITCDYTDPDGNVVAIRLTTSDGGEYNDCNVQHTFTQAGSVLIRLTLTDDAGGVATIDKTVNVLPGSSGGITGLAILNDQQTALGFVIDAANSIVTLVVAIITSSLALWLFISWMVAKKAQEKHGSTVRAMYMFIGVIWLGYFLGFMQFWESALITLAILVILDSQGVRVPVISELRERIQNRGAPKLDHPVPASEAGVALPPPKPHFDFSPWLGGNK